MPRTAAFLFLLVLGAGVACGPAPVPIESAPGAETSALPPGHPPLGGGEAQPAGLPPGHPPVGAGGAETPGAAPAGDVRFAGVVRIRGALADAGEGFVLVSIKPEGIRMPSFSRKYALSEATPDEGGELRLAFELDESDMMGGLAPGGLVLEARYDPDGFVESKEGVVVATAPITLGESAAEIVLDG